jgi:putative colanic acid biosysnthesis UDP-glucose lipid carrier transferase
MLTTTRYSKYFKPLNLTGDILILLVAFFIVYYFNFRQIQSLVDGRYFELLLFFNIAWITASYILQVYEPKRTISVELLFKGLLNALGLYLLLIFAYVGLKENKFDKIFVFQCYCFTSLGIIVFHLTFFLILKSARLRGLNFRRVLIAGHGSISSELKNFFLIHPEYGYRFFGFFDDHKTTSNIIGKISDIESYAIENNIDEIYCVLPYLEFNKLQKLIEFAENNFIRIKMIPDFRGFPYRNLEVSIFDNIPILVAREQPLDSALNRLIKRSFDLFITGISSILILWWLIPVIAIFIRLESKGPVFYKQYRTGKDNKTFKCYKFRTMNVHNEPEHKQATKEDSRITKIGKFLRKTSLDEIPQFLNILRNEMSIIGPRPHPIKLNEHFQPQINKFTLRHAVKPGITGLAQSKGLRGETETVQKMKNRVKLDRFYVENWSFLLDLKIIIATILLIFRGDKNAY